MAVGGPIGGRYAFDSSVYNLPSRTPTYSSYSPAATSSYGSYSPTSLGRLTSDVTNLNIAGQQAANAARIPMSTELETQSSKMISDQLSGKLPADVVALLGQSAGEGAVSSGMVGAPASWAAYQRALGLTSTDLQERGQRNLSAALARNPGARAMDAESQLITPYQQAQLDMEQQRIDLARRGSGGGGGGGYSPRVSTTGDQGTGGYVPTAQSLFGGRSGMIYSPTPRTSPSYAGYADAPALEGYYPTSSGGMYMGSQEGFDQNYWDYTGGGWEDEFFGGY